MPVNIRRVTTVLKLLGTNFGPKHSLVTKHIDGNRYVVILEVFLWNVKYGGAQRREFWHRYFDIGTYVAHLHWCENFELRFLKVMSPGHVN